MCNTNVKLNIQELYNSFSFSHSLFVPFYIILLYTNLHGIRALMASETPPSATDTDKSSSPYFLHSDDSPGALLVSQILTGDNHSS